MQQLEGYEGEEEVLHSLEGSEEKEEAIEMG